MKGYKHLTASQKLQIDKAFLDLKSAPLVSEFLGIRLPCVRSYLKRKGHKMTGYRPSACTRNSALVLKMIEEDASLAMIARAVGTTRNRVRDFVRRIGITKKFPTIRRGDRNPKWRGGRVIDKDGYVLIYSPNHPHASHSSYVREHRLSMEKHLGRYLTASEVVHHKDKNKQNNHISNLELFSDNSLHLKHELTGKIPHWTENGKMKILEGLRLRKPRSKI